MWTAPLRLGSQISTLRVSKHVFNNKICKRQVVFVQRLFFKIDFVSNVRNKKRPGFVKTPGLPPMERSKNFCCSTTARCYLHNSCNSKVEKWTKKLRSVAYSSRISSNLFEHTLHEAYNGDVHQQPNSV